MSLHGFVIPTRRITFRFIPFLQLAISRISAKLFSETSRAVRVNFDRAPIESRWTRFISLHFSSFKRVTRRKRRLDNGASSFESSIWTSIWIDWFVFKFTPHGRNLLFFSLSRRAIKAGAVANDSAVDTRRVKRRVFRVTSASIGQTVRVFHFRRPKNYILRTNRAPYERATRSCRVKDNASIPACFPERHENRPVFPSARRCASWRHGWTRWKMYIRLLCADGDRDFFFGGPWGFVCGFSERFGVCTINAFSLSKEETSKEETSAGRIARQGNRTFINLSRENVFCNSSSWEFRDEVNSVSGLKEANFILTPRE